MAYNYDEFNGQSLVFKYNVDNNGNPITVKVENENKQVSTHGTIQLEYVPDEFNRVLMLDDKNKEMVEVFNKDEITPTTYYIDYNNGVAYLDKTQFGKTKIYNYYSRGLQLIGCSRIFDEHDVRGQNVLLTLQEIIDAGKECIRILLNIGDAWQIIQRLERDIAEGRQLILDIEGAIVKAKADVDGMLVELEDKKTDCIRQIDEAVQNGMDNIVNVAGNIEIQVPSTAWVLNNGSYEKQITHNLNSEKLHISAINSDTKEAITIGYKVVDKSNVILKSDENINANIILSASFYNPYLYGNGEIAEEVVAARGDKANLKERLDLVDSSLETIEKQRTNVNSLGIFSSETEDISDKLQNIFNNNNRLFFPNGKYIISKPIFLNSNLDILCDDNVEFYLKDMSRCCMFDTLPNHTYENITIVGGVYNGNDHGQGEQGTTGRFDFTNAFRFYSVKNLKVKNVKLKDIRGHAIEHWNCNGVVFEDIIFDQNMDFVTKPYGGSRRDGITGGSSNMVIRNVRGFTDDDMIAILSGVSWGGIQVNDIENITIDGVTCETKQFNNKTFNTWCGVRVACAGGKVTKNVTVNNVKGKVAMYLIRLGGYDTFDGGKLENILLNDIRYDGGNCYYTYDEFGVILIEQCEGNNLTISNVICNGESDFRGTFLYNKNSKIKYLTLSNIDYFHNNLGANANESPFIKDSWTDIKYTNVFIDNILLSNVKYNTTVNPICLYRKGNNTGGVISAITTLTGGGISTYSDSLSMIGGSTQYVAINSRDISVGDNKLIHQKMGYIHRDVNRIIENISDTLQTFSNRGIKEVATWTTFNAKDKVIMVTASETLSYRIQEDINYQYPIGYTIDIKRVDTSTTTFLPYIEFSNSQDIVGLTTSIKNRIYLKNKQSVRLVHLGNYKWGLINSVIDQF